MIAKVTNISRVQSSFRDTRSGVGISRGSAVADDCDQQEEDDDTEPKKDTSGCNDETHNDNDGNQGTSNHPQDEEEPEKIKDEKTHNPVEVETQADHHNPSSPRGDDEPRTDDNMQALPLAVIILRISWSSARDENMEASRVASQDNFYPNIDEPD
nr:hypothetical protein Iba_chr06bCG13410 [Ipomoea batatas]